MERRRVRRCALVLLATLFSFAASRARAETPPPHNDARVDHPQNANAAPPAAANAPAGNAPPENAPAGNAPPGNDAHECQYGRDRLGACLPAPPSRNHVARTPVPAPTPSASDVPAPSLAKWSELWSVPVGSTASAKGLLGLGQIAPRGSMILVASRGKPNEDDPDDGVHVIDGRPNLIVGERTVRIIKSPVGGRHDAGASDAIGVAVDGDFVVFGTYGGLVTRVRLDGVVDWVSLPLPEKTRPGLPALADVNDDKQLDVLVPLMPTTTCAAGTKCGAEWDQIVVALDGRTGKELWRLGSGVAPWTSPAGDTGERAISYDADRHEGEVFCEPRGCRFSFRLLDGTPSARAPDPERDFDSLANRQVSVDATLNGPNTGVGLFADAEGGNMLAPTALTALTVGATSGSRLMPLTNSPLGLDWPLGAAAESAPSLADVNDDGVWEILVVAGGALHAIETDWTGDGRRALWRGDLEATGAAPALRYSPKAYYSSRMMPRDRSRWLVRPTPADSASFTALASASDINRTKFAREPVVLASDTKDPPAIVDCNDQTYGTSEGWLVVKSGATWNKVPGTPWPVVAVGCADGAVVTEGLDGTRYVMKEPWSWRRSALYMLGLFAAAVALAVAYTSRQRAKHPRTEPATPDHELLPPAETRHAIVPDGARTDPNDALDSQRRLLTGLLNVLDNDDTRPPVTLALYGAWGSGKSSVMQMLRSELKATGRYIDVWFNAWRFQRENELAPALLQTIVDEVGRQSDSITRFAVIWNRIRQARTMEILAVVVPAIGFAAILAVSIHSLHNGGISTTNGAGAIASILALVGGGIHRLIVPLFKVFSLDPAKLLSSGDSKRRIRFVREFSGEFEDISRKLPDGTRLIVFIDDLDRCPPDRIVNVLETLSMLADTGSGFFVLAIDPVTVRRAIELSYKDLLTVAREEDPIEAAAFGAKYLEKMITLGVNVPILSASEVMPDARIDKRVPAEKPLDWFWARVMPGKPLLATLVVLGGLTFAGFHYASFVDTCLDLGSTWLASSTPAPSASPSAADLSAPPPIAHAVIQASDTPATTPAAPSASSAKVISGPAPAPGQRAPILDPPEPPAIVNAPFADAPSTMVRSSEHVVFGIGAAFGLALFGLVVLVLGDALRRRNIRASGPMGTDSTEFTNAFATMKESFVDTPRNVVRFTNLARFLYSVIAARRPSADTDDWAPSFFKLLAARWNGTADSSGAPPWLVHEMDQWLPSAPAIAANDAASGANGHRRTKDSVPTSSGPVSVAPAAAGTLTTGAAKG
jgi:hypothetical protein